MEFIEIERKEADKAAWLEKRKHYITGTDAAKLLGLSPFGSIFDVWLDKTGQAPEFAQSAAMRAGTAFESAILKMYAEDTDAKLEHVDGYNLVTCDKYPRLGASLDGWNHSLGIPVDAKNIRWKDEKWGDAWTDDFPDYYKTQLQVQMMVTGAKFAHLAVMFSGQDFNIYTMEYDEELAQQILDASEAFWPYVENSEMPEASGSESTSNYIKEHFAECTPDKEKEPDEELAKNVEAYVKASEEEKSAKARKDEAGNRIRVFMGEATVVPGFCTWKNNKGKTETDWEAVAKAAMENMSVLEREELVAKYTETKPGNRTLRITAKGF
ncbi:MAG: YqaJ viral recombinase family protein [Fibrobacter sp.]|nr:YqaJ viral recombinase family protein [Fibrobacter sp.]